MIIIHTSYEIITPESAAEGDVAERGWIDEYGTQYSLEEGIKKLRGCKPSSSEFHPGVWYIEIDADIDPRTCAEKRESYHIVADEDDQRTIFQAIHWS